MKVGACAGISLAAWLVAMNGCASDPTPGGSPQRVERAPCVDDALEIARKYAPVLYHEMDQGEFRADLPARIDFDGTMRGDDNWEHLPLFEVVPTVYYSVVETKTHLFIAYHVFHTRDFAWMRIGLHETHENDGENCQVVVDRASGKIVLLFTQAHYDGKAYAAPDAGFRAGSMPLGQGFTSVEDDRPAVFIESGGHGILSLSDDDALVDIAADGRIAFRNRGMVFRPARAGEAVAEPKPDATGPQPYVLESTIALLWDGVCDGSLLGDGGILDGTCDFVAAGRRYPTPRYYEADRFSGPFGPDRGIAPFALDFGFDCGTVGALFFDPARRYAECLVVPQPWSFEYTRAIPPK